MNVKILIIAIAMMFFIANASADSCMTLDTAGIVYNVSSNIVPTGSSPCINITAQNITFDCQGKTLINNTYDGYIISSNQLNTTIRNCNIQSSSVGRAIDLNGANNSLVINNNITGSGRGITLKNMNNTLIYNNDVTATNCIYLDSSVYNNIANNIMSLGSYGYYLTASSNNNNFANSTFNLFSVGAIYNFNSDSNIYTNTFINNSVAAVIFDSVLASGHSSHNIFQDFLATNITNTSIQLKTTAGSSNLNNTMINATYNNESIATNSELTKKWYFRVQVKGNTSLAALSNINVIIYDNMNTSTYSGLTDLNGYIPIISLADYYKNSTTTLYYSLYNVTARTSSFLFNSTLYNNNLTSILFIPEGNITVVNISLQLSLNGNMFNQYYDIVPTLPSGGGGIISITNTTQNNSNNYTQNISTINSSSNVVIADLWILLKEHIISVSIITAILITIFVFWIAIKRKQ